ncbi:MAG: hypothetical protein ABIR91_00185 [Candidatus Saccharimonadales bacterium]
MATKIRTKKRYPAIAVDPSGFAVWLNGHREDVVYDPESEDGHPEYVYASQVPASQDPDWLSWWYNGFIDYAGEDCYPDEYWVNDLYDDFVGFDVECGCLSCSVDRAIHSCDEIFVELDGPIVDDKEIAKWLGSGRMRSRDRVGQRRRNARQNWSYKYYENNAMHHRDEGYWRLETAASRLQSFMVASYDGI